jgi:hypothetical protein
MQYGVFPTPHHNISYSCTSRANKRNSNLHKVHLSLCQPWRHMGREVIAPRILNLDTRHSFVVSLTSRPLYSGNSTLDTPNIGVHKSRRLVAKVTKSCTVAPNVCVSSVWHLLHVTILAPNILRCSQFLQKSVHPWSKNYYYTQNKNRYTDTKQQMVSMKSVIYDAQG